MNSSVCADVSLSDIEIQDLIGCLSHTETDNCNPTQVAECKSSNECQKEDEQNKRDEGGYLQDQDHNHIKGYEEYSMRDNFDINTDDSFVVNNGNKNNEGPTVTHGEVDTLVQIIEQQNESSSDSDIQFAETKKKIQPIESETDSDDNIPLSALRNNQDINRQILPETICNMSRGHKSLVGPEATFQGENSDVENDINLKRKSRKRIRNESGWSRVKNKKARNSGESYRNAKGLTVPARMMGPGCGIKCRYKCKARISEEQRENVFKAYWALSDLNRQRDFVVKNVTQYEKRRRTTCSPSRRTHSLSWSLEIDGVKTNVCKTFFLHTLDISDKVVITAINKKQHGIVQSDRRGKHALRPNSLPASTRENVRQHIRSFPRIESHYLRKDTSREYLEEGLNLSKMYYLYRAWCADNGKEPAKQWLYEDIFNKEFNLSFFRPKKDLCDLCEKYKNSSEEEKKDMKHVIDQHIKNKEMSRKEKDEDKKRSQEEQGFVCAAFDLQKVLPVPTGDVSLMYYRRKLSVYNFTVFDIGDRSGYCYMWPENIAKRGANEIGSCIWNFLQNQVRPEVKEVTFYSDNCVGQNKNRIIPTVYMKAVSSTNINIVTHKFLERGHTQNEGDSVHSTIEKCIGKSKIFSPQQYYILARTAKTTGKSYIVTEMETNDFLDFKALSETAGKNWNIDDEKDKVPWTHIRVIQARKSSPGMIFYKTQYDQDFISITLAGGKRRSGPIDLKEIEAPLCYNAPNLISKAKYNDLKYLCESRAIPQTYHSYFLGLSYSE